MRGCFHLLMAIAITPTAALAAPSWELYDQNGFNAVVYDVVEYRGDLVVTGNFTEAGGKAANHIARWDGTEWQPLGSGLRGDESTSDPLRRFGHALIVFEDDLYVGGHFQFAGEVEASYVARWNGEEWFAVGDGFTDRVYDFEIFQGRLVAAGSFRRTGVNSADRVAELRNGSWRGLGEGFGAPCLTLQVHDGQLCAGGMFKVTGTGRSLNRVAAWDGGVWIGLGDLFSVYQSRQPPISFVQDMTVHEGQLTVTGTFDLVGENPIPGIARWDGRTWQRVGEPENSLGTIESGFSITSYNGELYVGGRLPGDASDPKRFVARFDGARWASLGPGVDDFVQALVPIGSELFVGGAFQRVGGQPSSGLAIWRTDSVPVLRPVVDLRREPRGVTIHGLVEGLQDETTLRVERDAGGAALRRSVDVLRIRPGEPFVVEDPDAPLSDLRYWLAVESGSAGFAEFGPFVLSAAGPVGNGLDLIATGADAPVRVRLRSVRAGSVRLEVFDLRGRRVRTLLNERVAAGERVLDWDGLDASGRRVVRGRYFLRAVADDWTDVVRATLPR